MSDTEPQKKTVLIRIEEWTAWIPQRVDGQLFMSSGVTGFEAFENEKVLEVAVTSAGTQKHFPAKDEDGNDINVRHGLYAFQAVLASNFDGPVPEQPGSSADANSLLLPGHKNREQRRKESKK